MLPREIRKNQAKPRKKKSRLKERRKRKKKIPVFSMNNQVENSYGT
jgi:hypothetical protein